MIRCLGCSNYFTPTPNDPHVCLFTRQWPTGTIDAREEFTTVGERHAGTPATPTWKAPPNVGNKFYATLRKLGYQKTTAGDYA